MADHEESCECVDECECCTLGSEDTWSSEEEPTTSDEEFIADSDEEEDEEEEEDEPAPKPKRVRITIRY